MQTQYVDAVPQEQQQEYYPPVASLYQNKADLFEKMNQQDVVEELRHRLLGEDLINGVWKLVPSLKNRALSKIGAWELSTLGLGVSNKNLSTSKLNDFEIRNRLLAISRQAQESCLKNWKEYGITGTDQLGYVNEILFSVLLIALKQTEGAGIRKFLGGITTENRIINENQPEKKSRFGWLRPR